MVSWDVSGAQGDSGNVLYGNSLQLPSPSPDPYEEAFNACLLGLVGQRHITEGQGFAKDVPAS